jgi:tRNA (guanine-N(7)-)-methyltransferase (EC 2.1.1.33)
MPKNKLMKFDEMKTMERVFEPIMADFMEGNYPLKGNWRKEVFKNENPIVLELGCGKGEYSVGLGRKYPNQNFVGIDIKGARIWRGAKDANEENLTNVVFLRNVVDFVEHFFAANEVDEIWCTFSDPQPKKPTNA